jgi:branched-chain amino acid transport system permease protein
VLPSEFSTFAGVVWLAVLVTIGVRSNAAALIAGAAFVMMPAISQAYLPVWTGNVPPILFGLGAIGAAKYPEGTVAQVGRLFRHWLLRVAGRADEVTTVALGSPVGKQQVADGSAPIGARVVQNLP